MRNRAGGSGVKQQACGRSVSVERQTPGYRQQRRHDASRLGKKVNEQLDSIHINSHSHDDAE
jgi:hypothetical protein